MKRVLLSALLISGMPFVMGAKGGCGGAYSSTDPAPDVSGNWSVAYDDSMTIDVNIGGAVYHQTLSGSGGTFTINHQGTPITFNIDCSRPEVVCPSEVWPSMVSIDQRDPMYPHRMWVKIPSQTCNGTLVTPPASECGTGTLNPDCKPVCNGTLTTTTADAFGVIADDGASFDLLLGAGVATNGINCALLGASWAHASLTDTGASTPDWQAQSMTDGTIKTSFAGGCLWAGDPNQSGQLQALLVGASVDISTPFTATRLPAR